MTRTPLLPALALGLLLTAGCAADPSPTGGAEDRQRPRVEGRLSPPAAPTATTTPEPSAAPRAEQPDRDPPRERRTVVARTAPPEPLGNALTIQRTRDSHLLGAGSFGSGWSVARTGREAGRMTSACQRATLHDIGATETRVRDFDADGSAAAQAVSRFGDAKSAWRAEQVVSAWRADCAADLQRRAAALGTVRHGAWLSVVEVEGLARPNQRLRAVLAAVENTF